MPTVKLCMSFVLQSEPLLTNPGTFVFHLYGMHVQTLALELSRSIAPEQKRRRQLQWFEANSEAAGALDGARGNLASGLRVVDAAPFSRIHCAFSPAATELAADGYIWPIRDLHPCNQLPSGATHKSSCLNALHRAPNYLWEFEDRESVTKGAWQR